MPPSKIHWRGGRDAPLLIWTDRADLPWAEDEREALAKTVKRGWRQKLFHRAFTLGPEARGDDI